jgi:hypothetical protein
MVVQPQCGVDCTFLFSTRPREFLQPSYNNV